MRTIFDESNDFLKKCEECLGPSMDKDVFLLMMQKNNTKTVETHLEPTKELMVIKDHPKDQVIGGMQKVVTICPSLCNTCATLAFISQAELNLLKKAKDEH